MSRARGRLSALAALLLATMFLGATAAPPAMAKDHYEPKVGYLDAVYWPGTGDRFYSGIAFPAYPGQCVAVQRKSSDVGWTNTWVELESGYTTQCREYQWSITNDLAVKNTIAIRLYVITGANEGSYFNICNTKTQCLAMRP